ncbi:unnamed protein product [Umbelopsis ramanniana]
MAPGNLLDVFNNAVLRLAHISRFVANAEPNGQPKRNYERMALKALVQLTELSAVKTALVVCLIGSVPKVAATSYGEALSSGIQDISAVATLFGTEACAAHLLSSMSKGYMYAAVSMVSMFGSLAGVKSTAYLVVPAEWLKNAGMTDCGDDLNAMSWSDPAWPTNILADCLGSVKGGTPDVHFSKSARKWILRSIVAGLFSALGIVPFLAPLIMAWDHVYAAFPIMRVVGGTLISCITPIVTISIFRSQSKIVYKVLIRVLLVLGAAMTLIGYVGCYAYIQSFPEQWMVYQWLALEVVLMIIRFWCWAWNPSFDDLKELTVAYTPPIAMMAAFALPCYAGSWKKYVLNVATPKQVARGLQHAGLAIDYLPEASFFLIDGASTTRQYGQDYEGKQTVQDLKLYVIDTFGTDGEVTSHPVFCWNQKTGDFEFDTWMDIAVGGSLAWETHDTNLYGTYHRSIIEPAMRRLQSKLEVIYTIFDAVGFWAVEERELYLHALTPVHPPKNISDRRELVATTYANDCGCQHCLNMSENERITCLWYTVQHEKALPGCRANCIAVKNLPWTRRDMDSKGMRNYITARGRALQFALPLFYEERIFSHFRDNLNVLPFDEKHLEQIISEEKKEMVEQLKLPERPVWLS